MYATLLRMWVNKKITAERLKKCVDTFHWITEEQYETIIATPQKDD